jgi:hypothetical protein
VEPFDFVAEPTDSLAGREGVEEITRLVGILVGVPSSVGISNEINRCILF